MTYWVSPESHKQVCDALTRAIKERDRLRAVLAVFAEPESWSMRSYQLFTWNKLGDFTDPREFARRALEGE